LRKLHVIKVQLNRCFIAEININKYRKVEINMKINLEFEQDLDYIKDALIQKQSNLKTMVNEIAKSNPKNLEIDFVQRWGADILNIQGILDRLP
jgi:hypothetical protein